MKKRNKIPIFEQINPEEEILSFWNDSVKNIKGIPTHKNINSKVCISNNLRSEQLRILIQQVKMKYTTEEITEAIQNYTEILSSNQYYYEYKFKSLGFFLYSSKGLEQFLSVNNPKEKLKCSSWNPFSDIRDSIDFIVYDNSDKSNPLNTTSQTYLGVSLLTIKSLNVRLLYTQDLLPAFKSGDFKYGHLAWLEECIASLLYYKKDIELLEELINIHNKVSIKFKKKEI